MPRTRSIAAALAGTLALTLLAAAGVLGYVRTQVVDRPAFERRAIEAVRKPAVRAVVADRIVDEIISRGDPDLVTARPLLRTAVASVIVSAPFASVLRVAADDVHTVLFDRGRDDTHVRLAELASLIVSSVRSVDPQIAARLPGRLDVQLASLTVGDLAAGTPRVAKDSGGIGLVLAIGGVLLLALAFVAAPERRRALIATGGATMALSALVIVLAGARPRATGPIGQLSRSQVDHALSGAWWAFAGDLRTWALSTGAAGLLLVLVTSWRAPLPMRWRPRLAGVLQPGPTTPRRRALRAAAPALACLAIALAARPAGTAIAVLLAVALGLLALDELGLGRAEHARRHRRREPGSTSRRLVIALAATAVAAGAGAGLLYATHDAREIPGGAAGSAAGSADKGCNGSQLSCEKRINEVLFPGTHNSMSAIAHRGWVFTNQRYDIPRQLRDGIRLLLIDPHWGRRNGTSVRTDLEAEGSSRNRAVRTLGERRARLAESLAGDIGLGGTGGSDDVFLCHTLCELGATPMSQALRQIREFLDVNPRDVIVLSLESSVPPAAIQRRFEAAGLAKRAAVLARDAPLPTLGELVADHKQLVVFGNHDTGGIPWYLEADAFIQDTPVGASSCALRLGTGASPFLQVNHWIDTFPPRPSVNARIATRRRLLERIARCGSDRRLPVGLIAVDYYERTDVVATAREVNAGR